MIGKRVGSYCCITKDIPDGSAVSLETGTIVGNTEDLFKSKSYWKDILRNADDGYTIDHAKKRLKEVTNG
ncbi:MAG TPA: hypothetical protein ENI23_00460 [bacterium]|nr:hypothetical protein [bacterium]